jgi:hypothetical protein
MRKSRRLLLVMAAIAMALALMPLKALALSGAWSDAKVGPDLLYNNVEYCIDFNPTGQYVPANAQIVMISWQWDVFPNNPVVARVKEKATGVATDWSSNKIGLTHYFDTHLANQTFQLCFKKLGGGVTYGKGYDRINVSWQTP